MNERTEQIMDACQLAVERATAELRAERDLLVSQMGELRAERDRAEEEREVLRNERDSFALRAADRHEWQDVALKNQTRLERAEAALSGLLKRYTSLVNSGDCGNWNPEEEPEVIAARAALKP
jgi:hypothetical protein